MINKVVPDADLPSETHRIATLYAEKPPKALAYIKKLLLRSSERSYEEALQQELYYQELAGRTQDYQEGLRAFVEKRKPQFQGR
jgi:2-(1,2-epoxy-1,2-dihydrophenyl)acetyl-CoA isomerase